MIKAIIIFVLLIFLSLFGTYQYKESHYQDLQARFDIEFTSIQQDKTCKNDPLNCQFKIFYRFIKTINNNRKARLFFHLMEKSGKSFDKPKEMQALNPLIMHMLGELEEEQNSIKFSLLLTNNDTCKFLSSVSKLPSEQISYSYQEKQKKLFEEICL